MESILKHAAIFHKKEAVKIDNAVSFLHYRVTVIFLITVSAFMSSQVYSKDRIICSADPNLGKMVDQYCLQNSVHSTPESMPKSQSHWQYQWIEMCLFFQAMFFYLPRFLLKREEGQRTSILLQDLQHPLVSTETKKVQIVNIATYWSLYKGTHKRLAITSILSQVLYLVNIISQIFFTNWFLDGNFLSYGAILSFNEEERQEVMNSLFPKMSKCTFPTFTSFGTITNKDILCMLPMNQIHKFVYVVLWYWFALLAVVTFIQFVLFLITTCCNSIQFKRMSKTDNRALNKELKNLLLAGHQSSLEKMGDIIMMDLLLSNIELNATKEQIVKEICLLQSKSQ